MNKKGDMVMDRMAKVDMWEEKLMEGLGAESFLDALVRALNYDVKEDVFEYIGRHYDVELDEEAEEE